MRTSRKRREPEPQALTTPNIGDVVVVTRYDDRGDIGDLSEPERYMVHASCGSEQKHSGVWVCLTHKIRFSNQFCKDSHIHEGAHCLAWLCTANDSDHETGARLELP